MALVAYVAVEGCRVQKPGSRHDGPARYLSTTEPYLVEELSEKGQRMAQRALRGEVRRVPDDEVQKAAKAREDAQAAEAKAKEKAAEKAAGSEGSNAGGRKGNS